MVRQRHGGGSDPVQQKVDKVVAKETDKLVKRHVNNIHKVAAGVQDAAAAAGPYGTPSLAKSIEWSTLINTMTREVHKRARKLSAQEVEGTIRGAINLVTADRANELVPADVFTSTVTMAMVLQDEAWKTRCWGVCGKKTVG